MFKTRKKLALKAETVRTLRGHQLRAAVGGQTLAGCSAQCSQDICPDTQFNHGCNGQTVKCGGTLECQSEVCTGQCTPQCTGNTLAENGC